MSGAVALGEDKCGLMRGVQRGEGFLEVEHSHVVRVGVGFAAFSPADVGEAGGCLSQFLNASAPPLLLPLRLIHHTVPLNC